jgi:hypothetical protein
MMSSCIPHYRIREQDKNNRTFEEDRVTKFFKGPFTELILNPKARAVIFVLYIAWIIPAMIFACNLKPTTRAQQVCGRLL